MDINFGQFFMECPSLWLLTVCISFLLQLDCRHEIKCLHLQHTSAAHFTFVPCAPCVTAEHLKVFSDNSKLVSTVMVATQRYAVIGEGKSKCCLGQSESLPQKGVMENPCMQWTIMFETFPEMPCGFSKKQEEWDAYCKLCSFYESGVT